MFKNISIFISWTLAIVFFSGCSFFKKKPTSLPKEQTAFYHDTSIKEVADCKSAREYIATSEYLKSQSKYFESSLELQKVSTKVAVGCTGAAQRFIKTYKSLMKVEAGTRLAVKEGIMLANSTDDVTKTYLNVFMTSYLKNYLDMDVTTSVKLARALSVNYNGDPKIANKDFKKFVEFCIKSKNLDLPRPQCASFSRRWASYGAGYKKGVFKPFKKMFNFLKSNKGPGLTTIQALKKTENVVKVSPFAVENYILAYKYAIKKKGLAFETVRALKFADNMAHRTRWVASEPEK